MNATRCFLFSCGLCALPKIGLAILREPEGLCFGVRAHPGNGFAKRQSGFAGVAQSFGDDYGPQREYSVRG